MVFEMADGFGMRNVSTRFGEGNRTQPTKCLRGGSEGRSTDNGIGQSLGSSGPEDEESDRTCDVALSSRRQRHRAKPLCTRVEISTDTHSQRRIGRIQQMPRRLTGSVPVTLEDARGVMSELWRGTGTPACPDHHSRPSDHRCSRALAVLGTLQRANMHLGRFCFSLPSHIVSNMMLLTPPFYDDKKCIILQRPDTGSPPPIFIIPHVTGPRAR